MSKHETFADEYERVKADRLARKNRNWFTRHELPLDFGLVASGLLAYHLSSKTADGSAADWFLVIVVTVAALGMVLMAPLAVIELWLTIREDRYLHRMHKQQREDEQ